MYLSPRGRSAADRILESQARVPWPLVLAVCCAGSGLCDGLITCSEEPYRVGGSNFVRSRNLENEEVKTRVGLMHHRKKDFSFKR
jgi:hypothetical protein